MAARFGTRGVVFPGPPPKALAPIPAARDQPDSREFFRCSNSEPSDTNPSGPMAMIADMEMAREFSLRTGLRVYLGEFGSIIQADLGSRARWTHFVRTEAERRGFGWAYWDYCRNLLPVGDVASGVVDSRTYRCAHAMTTIGTAWGQMPWAHVRLQLTNPRKSKAR